MRRNKILKNLKGSSDKISKSLKSTLFLKRPNSQKPKKPTIYGKCIIRITERAHDGGNKAFLQDAKNCSMFYSIFITKSLCDRKLSRDLGEIFRGNLNNYTLMIPSLYIRLNNSYRTWVWRSHHCKADEKCTFEFHV